MSITRARSQLKLALAPSGFVQCSPNLFWGRTDEVLQLVRIGKVRRIPDALEVELGFWSPFGAGVATAGQVPPQPLVSETIGDTALTADIWKPARFCASDIAWRVGQVGAAFTLAADITRHYCDRYHDEWIGEALNGAADLTRLDGFAAPRIQYANAAIAPSEASMVTLLRKLEVALFGDTWEPCPGMDGHWMNKAEAGGFRYCAYLQPNRTGTLASMHFYAATSADLERPASNASLTAIHRASKYSVRSGMLALHIPLLDTRPGALETARLLLREAIKEFPANAIRPLANEDR